VSAVSPPPRPRATVAGREREPPAWVNSEQTKDDGYDEVLKLEQTGAGHALDLYFDDRAEPGCPLVLFHHIRKTGGTSLRHLIYSNKGEASFEPVRLERIPKRRNDLALWHESAYASLGGRRDRLVCVAGHTANYLLPLIGGRPVVALTLLRDPIERAMSRYDFVSKRRNRSLDDLDAIRSELPMKKLRALSNGQAESLLAAHYDTRSLPVLSEHRDADLWRRRLFELVDRLYLVGLQDHFLQSVELFGQKLGWSTLYPASVRVNWTRPREPLSPQLVDAFRQYHWLDEELYRRACERFDREGPSWEAGGWG
jgi:hypothetical protein